MWIIQNRSIHGTMESILTNFDWNKYKKLKFNLFASKSCNNQTIVSVLRSASRVVVIDTVRIYLRVPCINSLQIFYYNTLRFVEILIPFKLPPSNLGMYPSSGATTVVTQSLFASLYWTDNVLLGVYVVMTLPSGMVFV